MKRLVLVFIMMAMLVGFSGCAADDDAYIKTVKTIEFENGDSVEDIVKYKLIGTDLAIKNQGVVRKIDNFLYFDETGDYVLASSYASNQIIDAAKRAQYSSTKIEPTIIWEVEGETSQGKVIVATSEYGKVRVTTKDDGDYVSTSMYDIEQIKWNENLVSDKTIDTHMFINNLLENN